MIKAKRENAMSETVNIRELVLDILLNVTKQGEYSHIAEKQVLEKYQYLNKKDRAFLTRLTEGTLENLIQIDYIINQFSKVPVHKMKPVICCIIRSGVYQIRFMDAVPDAAACNEAVRLAKKKGFQNLSGFVNGVLRNISRSKDRIVWPDKEKDRDHWLSVHRQRHAHLLLLTGVPDPLVCTDLYLYGSLQAQGLKKPAAFVPFFPAGYFAPAATSVSSIRESNNERTASDHDLSLYPARQSYLCCG